LRDQSNATVLYVFGLWNGRRRLISGVWRGAPEQGGISLDALTKGPRWAFPGPAGRPALLLSLIAAGFCRAGGFLPRW